MNSTGIAIQIGLGDGSEHVGEAGPRGGDRDAEPARLAGIGVRRVSGSRLVAGIDELQVVIETGLEDRIEMTAVKNEGVLYTGCLQSLNEEFAAIMGHDCLPLGAWRFGRIHATRWLDSGLYGVSLGQSGAVEGNFTVFGATVFEAQTPVEA